jgi:hypothetical protein
MLILNLLTACRFASPGVMLRPPPEAPEDLNELSAYIYQRVNDEDQEELQAGLTNLFEWLHEGDNIANTIEGYQIKNLNNEAIANLDDKERTVGDQLVGAAVAHIHDWSFTDILRATVVTNYGEVSNDYEFYERTFDQDSSCMLDRSCLGVNYESHSITTWAGLVTVETRSKGQVRWVETEDYGWMTILRSWMNGPATVDPAIVDANAHYYIEVLMEGENGKMLRTSATWIDTEYGSLPVDEGWAKSQVVDSMKDQDEAISDWIAENPEGW